MKNSWPFLFYRFTRTSPTQEPDTLPDAGTVAADMPDPQPPEPAPLEEEPKLKPLVRPWLIVLFALFVAYPLSPGPVLWLCDHVFGKGAYQFVRFVHIPLIFLYEHIPAVHSFYDWYFSLFGVR